MQSTKTIDQWNLDDESEVNEFISLYGAMVPFVICMKLGANVKENTKNARDLKNYAWNKRAAIELRKSGNIQLAMVHEAICDKIYAGMSEHVKW